MASEVAWSDFTQSDSFRSAQSELRTVVKQKYFERILLPKLTQRTQDKQVLEQAFLEFMERPNDTGEPLPISIIGQTLQTFAKPIHAPFATVGKWTGNDTLSGWGSTVGDAAYIHFPVNEIHRDSVWVRYVGTGLGLSLWVLLVYLAVRTKKGIRTAKHRATLGPRITELQAFEMAAADLKNGQKKEGLWSKCYSENDGHEQKTTACYLKTRTAQIRAQDAIRPYTGDTALDAPVPSPSFISSHARTIIIAFALALTILSMAAPPVEFKKTISRRTESYVEHRYLWDMEPRKLGAPNGSTVFNEYSGIDLPRLGLQLVGIAALAGGLLAATSRFKRT
jgi:hypothetical protein